MLSDISAEQDGFDSLDIPDLGAELGDFCLQTARRSLVVHEYENMEQISDSARFAAKDDEINLGLLMERCEDDIDLVFGVVNLFCEQGIVSCSKMIRSVETGQYEELRFHAVRCRHGCACQPIIAKTRVNNSLQECFRVILCKKRLSRFQLVYRSTSFQR